MQPHPGKYDEVNIHGSFYSVVVVNQPEKIRTIDTKQTKYLRSVSQENNTGGIGGHFVP